MRGRLRERVSGGVSRPNTYAARGLPLLLDTHVWIWWIEGVDRRFDGAAMRLLTQASDAGELMVSDISSWEVAIKCAKGTLRFPMDAAVWLERAERVAGMRTVPLSRQVLVHSTRLAGSFHGDPADRMIVATATLLGTPLVTADRAIIEYAAKHAGLQVIDIRRR